MVVICLVADFNVYVSQLFYMLLCSGQHSVAKLAANSGKRKAKSFILEVSSTAECG